MKAVGEGVYFCNCVQHSVACLLLNILFGLCFVGDFACSNQSRQVGVVDSVRFKGFLYHTFRYKLFKECVVIGPIGLSKINPLLE